MTKVNGVLGWVDPSYDYRYPWRISLHITIGESDHFSKVYTLKSKDPECVNRAVAEMLIQMGKDIQVENDCA